MGLLVNGQWRDAWYDTEKTQGRFVRNESAFRNWVTPDGGAGPSGQGGFKAELGRYHLYVSLACPWASRAVIFRKLKRLDNVISISIVDPFMGENGWAFSAPDGSLTAGSTPDDIMGARFLYTIYLKAKRDYTGRVTVPVLWDKRHRTIVNNESAEIIRMFNDAFDEWGDATLDLYPTDLREQVDQINSVVYDNVNNGVYKCGFATSQQAYNESFDALFKTLDDLEARLDRQRYLAGSRLTELGKRKSWSMVTRR